MHHCEWKTANQYLECSVFGKLYCDVDHILCCIHVSFSNGITCASCYSLQGCLVDSAWSEVKLDPVIKRNKKSLSSTLAFYDNAVQLQNVAAASRVSEHHITTTAAFFYNRHGGFVDSCSASLAILCIITQKDQWEEQKKILVFLSKCLPILSCIWYSRMQYCDMGITEFYLQTL